MRCYNEKVGMYFLLVREDSFTWWIGKALLLFILHNSERLESILKRENHKLELTLEFTYWDGWSWLWNWNLCGAMFGPLLKIMFFNIRRLLYLVPKIKRMKIFILKDNWRSSRVSREVCFQKWRKWPLFDDESLQGTWLMSSNFNNA